MVAIADLSFCWYGRQWLRCGSFLLLGLGRAGQQEDEEEEAESDVFHESRALCFNDSADLDFSKIEPKRVRVMIEMRPSAGYAGSEQAASP